MSSTPTGEFRLNPAPVKENPEVTQQRGGGAQAGAPLKISKD